jgi:hypothetical protein
MQNRIKKCKKLSPSLHRWPTPKILVIKANLDTVYLVPSTEPYPEEMIVENEDE